MFVDTRYNRQELIPQLGQEGQSRLNMGKVAVIGAGGVKSPLLYYLTAAGVGFIRIIDFDKVELSNLNRQILFTENDIGKNKAIAAKARLSELNSEITIEAIEEKLTSENIDRLLSDVDVIVEGGDSLQTRLLVNRHSICKTIPMVHSSAQYNYGYVFTVLPNSSACFECIFPDLPSGHGGSVPVMGISTGLAGTLAASEVIKLLTNIGRPVINGMLSFSGFLSEFQFAPSARRNDCASCGNKT